jgi:chromosome segregation protein
LFLKALTLKGFKSFADSTRLALTPGITVVVGPNGSGKSNIVDAVGWVLGAQAPSVVRSKSMDDVIFAGTSKRPALGRAEVALTLDNGDGILPIDFTEVTISRTLFRSGDSEYAINGVPCRLLDIQELLSDSGVGRQQHVIVSQGQIDAVLNARPEERRAIIEEAAGVLKYRRRKEKAERRLAATEGNLTRLQDLLREVRRQLRPLEKQADAARRHGAVVAELEALRIHIAGREITDLRGRLATGSRQRAELEQEAADLTQQLAELDAGIMAAEEDLAARGGDDLGDALVRFEALRERARGLGALLDERGRGIERDRSSFVDQGVIFTLEAEAARAREELDEVGARIEGLGPERVAVDQEAAALGEARQAFEERYADVDLQTGGGAAEARGELAALRSGIERDRAELGRLTARTGTLETRRASLVGELDRLRGEVERLTSSEQPLVTDYERAEIDRRASEEAAAEAEREQREADGALHRWEARADALAIALDEARARAGADRVGDVAGVIGTLQDVVEVDEGWAAAFQAAAGDALRSVLVTDADAARRAIRSLRDGDVAGALLPVSGTGHRGTRPPVGEPVRPHVRSSVAGVDDLLDRLLGGATAVAGGWEAAVDAALDHPEAVIVTRDGDRFGASGWHIGGRSAGATRAALDEARQQAADARLTQASAEARLREAREHLDQARSAEQRLASGIDDHDTRRTAALAAVARAERDAEEVGAELASLSTHHAELHERIDREATRLTGLQGELGELEAQDEDLAATGRTLQASRRELDERGAALASRRTDLDVALAGLDERRQFLTARLTELDERLARDAAERAGVASRREELDRRQLVTARLRRHVQDRLEEIESVLEGLREGRRAQSEATRAVARRLDDLRTERAEAERRLATSREQTQRLEIGDAEVRLKLEAVIEVLRREQGCEPDRAVEAERPELPDGTTPSGRARELERDLRLMGPINPLALHEHEELQARHEFLQGQLEDVRSTRRDLNKVIRAIDDEIVSVFAAAYADVAENFEQLFETLFPGGRGTVKLTDPDDLLTTGIEVEARPSGKNVRKLSLLSGGERSLTALAFLFAVFRSRPSPFYVLDEVEAALDDVNLHRFLDLLAEFRREAQLIVVSHQKRTMEAADVLYGVSMQDGGSSRVVSEPAADVVEVA